MRANACFSSIGSAFCREPLSIRSQVNLRTTSGISHTHPMIFENQQTTKKRKTPHQSLRIVIKTQTKMRHIDSRTDAAPPSRTHGESHPCRAASRLLPITAAAAWQQGPPQLRPWSLSCVLSAWCSPACMCRDSNPWASIAWRDSCRLGCAHPVPQMGRTLWVIPTEVR